MHVEENNDCSKFAAFKSHENCVVSAIVYPKVDEFGEIIVKFNVDKIYELQGLNEGYRQKSICCLVWIGTDVRDNHVAKFDSDVENQIDDEYEYDCGH